MASPQYWKEKYDCGTCGTAQILIELTAGGGSGVGEGCRAGVCAGTLESSVKENYRCDTCPRVVNGASLSKGLNNSVCGDRCTGTSQAVISPMNWLARKVGRATSVKTTYRCDRCSTEREVVELSNQVGSHQQVCNVVCAGSLRAVAGSRTAQELLGPRPHLNLPSAGEALGVPMCGAEEGPISFWAHEVAHHKHFEHAGDKIIVPAQHDRAANTVDATVQGDADVKSQEWDRACVMSYKSVEAGPDRTYFCGKCILKLRGWKVETGIADPAGNEAGP